MISSVILGLAWLAAVNTAASAAAWFAAQYVLRSRLAERGAVLLAIRVGPAVASTAFVAALFLPAHWRLEPADAGETFGIVLRVLAVAGAALILRSLRRALLVARAGRRLRACRRLADLDRSLGIYEVAGFPGVALAGVFRTRILVGADVRQSLSEGELDVALAHELAHRGAHDNVKRFAIFCAADIFSLSAVSHRIEARWRATAECVADARAVQGDARRALSLAAALLKVSRIGSPASSFATSPAWSTLDDPPLLETRVRRLVDGAAAVPPRSHAVPLALAASLAGLLLLSSDGSLGAAVHQLTEALVRLLP